MTPTNARSLQSDSYLNYNLKNQARREWLNLGIHLNIHNRKDHLVRTLYNHDRHRHHNIQSRLTPLHPSHTNSGWYLYEYFGCMFRICASLRKNRTSTCASGRTACQYCSGLCIARLTCSPRTISPWSASWWCICARLRSDRSSASASGWTACRYGSSLRVIRLTSSPIAISPWSACWRCICAGLRKNRTSAGASGWTACRYCSSLRAIGLTCSPKSLKSMKCMLAVYTCKIE